VLELRRPLTVLGDDGPAVLPDLVVDTTEVDHRFDREDHARFDDGLDRGLVVVQDHEAVVEGLADSVSGEIPDDAVPESVGVRLDNAERDGDAVRGGNGVRADMRNSLDRGSRVGWVHSGL